MTVNCHGLDLSQDKTAQLVVQQVEKVATTRFVHWLSNMTAAMLLYLVPALQQPFGSLFEAAAAMIEQRVS